MKQKRRQALEALFGKAPDTEYFEEDMQGIRTYYEYRRDKEPDVFYVDDTTWNDLTMDEVYKRLNATLSTSGEQCLYYQLRTPAMDAETFMRRAQLIDAMERDTALRFSLQENFLRVGKRRAANTVEAFHPGEHSPQLLFVTIALTAALLGSLVGLFFASIFARLLVAILLINAVYHTYMMHRVERDMATINYTVSMVLMCRRMRKLRHPFLHEHFHALFAAGERTKSIARMGGISRPALSDFLTLANLFFLTDILLYERLKNRLARHHADILYIHETLGALDAAIAVASYRKCVQHYATPFIDFDPVAAPFLYAEGLVHPLLAAPVPNDLDTDRPLLVTGSNASGKSTFLKAVAAGSLLAQVVCTAPCTTYAATSFHLYTSMAITDNVVSGDSYFIAEIKSIKRIVDAVRHGDRVLCVIDEVLRGTNTVERIAASSELLSSLPGHRAICLAATHDGELCTLLPGYRQMHFEEVIKDGEIHFDYLLKEGPATTRNAIKLLALLGFDDTLVTRASKRAEAYLSSGRWSV